MTQTTTFMDLMQGKAPTPSRMPDMPGPDAAGAWFAAIGGTGKPLSLADTQASANAWLTQPFQGERVPDQADAVPQQKPAPFSPPAPVVEQVPTTMEDKPVEFVQFLAPAVAAKPTAPARPVHVGMAATSSPEIAPPAAAPVVMSDAPVEFVRPLPVKR